MKPRLVVEGADRIEEYARIPIRFRMEKRVVATPIDGGFALRDVPVLPPLWYDYDEFDPPATWREWDLRNWGFIAAFEGAVRVGGAAVAMKTADLGILEGRTDLACLWDIRVDPAHRGSGIGRELFEAARKWADERGSIAMKVETQDINAPACRFYERQGCRLIEANAGIYERHPGQVQLIWSLAPLR